MCIQVLVFTWLLFTDINQYNNQPDSKTIQKYDIKFAQIFWSGTKKYCKQKTISSKSSTDGLLKVFCHKRKG